MMVTARERAFAEMRYAGFFVWIAIVIAAPVGLTIAVTRSRGVGALEFCAIYAALFVVCALISLLVVCLAGLKVPTGEPRARIGPLAVTAGILIVFVFVLTLDVPIALRTHAASAIAQIVFALFMIALQTSTMFVEIRSWNRLGPSPSNATLKRLDKELEAARAVPAGPERRRALRPFRLRRAFSTVTVVLAALVVVAAAKAGGVSVASPIFSTFVFAYMAFGQRRGYR